MGKPNEITGFGGVICAYEKIPNNHSADQVNVRTEDGTIRPRFGYNSLRGPGSGFTAVHGFEYLHGYDTNRAEQEEYVSFEARSGNVRAYSNNVTTGASTEITNSGGSVNLHASEWVATTFRENAFFINPNNASPLYRHAIGTNTSLTPVAVPTAPAAAPAYTIKYGGGDTPYSQMSFAGINVGTEIAYTGSATATNASLESDNSLIIGHLSSSKLESSFEVDLSLATAGVLDFTYNDFFAFVLTAVNNSFDIDPGSIRVQFSNNDGTPLTLIPSSVGVHNNSVRPAGTTGNSYIVQFGYIDKIRANFDNIKKFKVSYRVRSASSTATKNGLAVSKPYIGGVAMELGESVDGPDGRYVGYSYYYSTPGWESGVSPLLFIPGSVLGGYSPAPGISGLGVHVEITMVVSSDTNVDKFRIYEQDRATPPVFHRIGEQADSDATFDFRMTYVETLRQTEYAPTPFVFDNAQNAFSHKGFVVWCYKGGEQNIRCSRVGDPLRQFSQEDTDEDLGRGATFSLADNFGDEPLGGVSVGDALMVAGKLGVYASFGDYPAQLTPLRKVSGSSGVAGKYAFCRWKNDQGLTGMVYVSISGQVYFAVPNESGGDQVLLSEVIREGVKSLKSWLLDGQPGLTDYSTCQVRLDERDNEIVIIMGKRGLRLKRPDLRGVRSWDPEDYNTGSDTATIRFLASSTKYGIRWMRSTGQLDEDNYNNAAGQYVEGVDRDGGNPMPPAYWKTQLFTGENRRILRVLADRTPVRIDQRIRIHSQRKTQVYKILAYRGFAKCLPEQQGRLHAFEIMVNEETGAISRLHWDESMLSRRFGA